MESRQPEDESAVNPTPPAVHGHKRPTIVYLDQNAWVNLLRISHLTPGSGSTYEEFKIAQAAGRAIFPLSATHYLETWHRSDWESRYNLAAIMHDLSNFYTLAPIQRIQEVEVARSVLTRLECGKLKPIPRYAALGYGVDHAFASEYGRFVYFEEVNERGEGSKPTIPSDEQRLDQVRTRSDWHYQWLSLAGFPDSMDIQGLDRTPQHRRGSNYAKQQQILSNWINKKENRNMLRRFLLVEEFEDLAKDINKTCRLHSLDPSPLIQTREMIMNFIESVPTRHVFSELRIARHRNNQQPWVQHDFADLLALSVAIPYCDIVVTEKQWCHVARQAHLDRKYGTVMASNLKQATHALSGY
jgi:hypothetical protein